MSEMWSVQTIGETAGEVWNVLRGQGGRTSLRSVEQRVERPVRLVDMAVGWLAREDKVNLEVTGRTIHVALRPE